MYKITNLINKKVYIGQTVQPNSRWSNHKSGAKTHQPVQYLHNAMIKYGVENFVFEIIALCKSLNDANEIEAILITQYNSRDHNFGYNLKPGGNTSSPSIETRQKMSASAKQHIIDKPHTKPIGRKGKPCSDELKEKLRLASSNKKHTEETRQKMSISAKRGEKHHATKLSDQDVLDIRDKYLLPEYSCNSLAKEYNVCRSNISSIIHGQTWQHLPIKDKDELSKAIKDKDRLKNSKIKNTI